MEEQAYDPTDLDALSGSKPSRRRFLAIAGLAASSIVLAEGPLSASAATKSVKVGAKDFTEDQLVAHMYTLLLQQSGFTVSEHFNLPTAIAHSSLVRGDIDLYPEYTGTGLVDILKSTAPNDPATYYKLVVAGYQKKFKLTWLDAAPMNDTQGLATTKSISQKYGVKTMSDMARQASKLRFIANSEFLTRPDGLPGLKKVYGNFAFKSTHIVAGAGSLRYAALRGGLGDIVVAFTTDGPIVADHLVLLQDDKHYAPPDNLAPVVRDDTLARYPEIKATLNKLAPKLTTTAVQEMNYQVDGQHMDLPTVAKTFLQQQGLLKK